MSDKIEMKPVKVDHVKLNNLLKGFVILFVVIVLWKCFGGFWFFGGSTTQKADEKKIEFFNTDVKIENGITEIVGEVKNKDLVACSFRATITFYNKSDKILGTAKTFVENLKPGESKTFDTNALEDYSGYKNYKIQIDSIYPVK